MLLRLTEDDVADAEVGGDALSRKFSDVATLFAALDPRVSRIMFGKLARAVLDLEPEPRQSLLRKTILPGLLDGKIDGTVLRDFPDVDLADSLCLLLDLETAAPEARHDGAGATRSLGRTTGGAAAARAVAGRRAHGLNARKTPGSTPTRASSRGSTARRARSFADFSAVRPRARSRRRSPRSTASATRIGASDTVVAQLECLLRLMRLEPNPEQVQRFVDRSTPLLEALEGEQRWQEMAGWLSRHARLAGAFLESRPDVAEVIAATWPGSARCTSRRAARRSRRARCRPDARRAAAIIDALGPAAGPPLLDARPVAARRNEGQPRRGAAALRSRRRSWRRRSWRRSTVPDDPTSLQRTIARVLGFAGPRLRGAARQAARRAPTNRPCAKRCAAWPGSARRARPRSSARRSLANRGWIGTAAEETLWHFPGPSPTVRSATCSDGASSSSAIRRPPAGCSTARRRAARPTSRRSCRRSCRSATASGVRRSSAWRGRRRTLLTP